MSNAQAGFADGDAYEKVMGRWSRVAGRSFLDWLMMSPGKRWLDVGCGNGAFTEEILARAAPVSVTGIDPAEGQVAYARKRPGTLPAEFHVGDALALPFADGGFDVAAMALVIAFVPDPRKAVSELRRVTAPGGTVASYMWDLFGGGLPLDPMYQAMKAMGLAPAFPPSAEISRRDAMTSLWSEAGLHEVESTVVPITVSFAKFEDLWDSFSLPVGPLAKTILGLDSAGRLSLKDMLRQKVPIGGDGSVSYPAFANAVKGLVP